MAMVLILLLISLFTENTLYFKIAIPVLIVNMVYPRFYHYFAIVWLGLSNLLGTILSKVILSIVYFLIVFPGAMIRKALGKDTLKLKQFKKSNETVMHIRNHSFT